MEVFCKDCKHVIPTNAGMFGCEKANFRTVCSWYDKKNIYETPAIKNMSNDCKDFDDVFEGETDE